MQSRAVLQSIPWLYVILLGAAHPAFTEESTNAQRPLLASPLNLLERFPVARIGLDDASIGQIPLDSAVHFSGGWYQASETANGELYRWLGPGAGVIDIALVEAEELTLRIGVTVPRDDRVPPIKARFHWNGEFAGAVEIDGRAPTVEMVVPARLTRPGMNRLEVFPSFWVNASRLAGGTSSSNVSINVFKVDIARATGARARASSVLPVARPDGSVEQYANTTISYFTFVGQNARLSAAGRWLDDPAALEPSEALILLRDGRGRTKTVLVEPSTGQVDPISTMTDLAEFAGSFVEISTIVRQTASGQARPRPILWTDLSVKQEILSRTDGPMRPANERPNIVMLVFDTLRADYLEPYGGSEVSTPNFRTLAERSATFMTAYSPTSWTRPAVATLMTSLHETRHGTISIADKLAEDVSYLPEMLQESGYTTIGVSMNGHITRQWGFDRGFDVLHEIGMRREQFLNENPAPEEYVNGLWDRYVSPGLQQRDGPFFLYLHEIDPHGPYTPRPPFDAMYPSLYTGHPELEADNINLVRLGLTELRPQEIAYLESRYRGEVSFIDAVLGALVDRLEREGLKENTILMVTSDHGEEFGEHGGIGHMVSLYDEVLRVPLIWSWPDRIRPTLEPAATGLIDVAPTLLRLLEMPVPRAMEGRDLSPVLTGAMPMQEYPILGHLTGDPERVRRSVFWAGWKLCERDHGPESEYELYDLAADPGEITNQWTSRREAGMALRQMLEWYAHISAGVTVAEAERVKIETLDPELVEQLRNLGYVQ